MTSLSIVPVENIPEAQAVPVDDLLKIYRNCLQMEEICTLNNGIGISAVQVGIPWKLFIILKNQNDESACYEYYVNCEYEPLNDEQFLCLEGCLSLRNEDGTGRAFEVDRYKSVRVKGQKLVSEPELHLEDYEEVFEYGNFLGVVFQHEIDHHHGKLISEFGKEVEVR